MFPNFDFILRNFTLFFWDFNKSSSRKKDLQMCLLKPEEKMMKNVQDTDQF